MEQKYNSVPEKLSGLDEFIELVMSEVHVPGLALAIVKDGAPLYIRGYGYRDPEKELPMQTDTLYRIASNTKAFVSLSIAILVDEGKLDWDTPVREYIPYFRLKDEYASAHATVRDLLCHRTGVPAHDRALRHFKTRKEMVENLRHLEPSYPIRYKLQYNNLMYMTAGHLIDCVAGQRWESFARERIFDPLGMERTTFSFAKSVLSGNFAECFYEKGSEVRRYQWNIDNVDPEYIYPRSPAGGINTTVDEIAKFMTLQLNKGMYNGKRIVSERAFKEMHSPQMTDNWNNNYVEYGEPSCCLGWFQYAYRGIKVLEHPGFYGSQVYLLPEHELGIAVFPTLNDLLPPYGLVSDVIMTRVVERMLDLDQINWFQRKIEIRIAERKKKDEEEKNAPRPTPETHPSHITAAYCGTYAHPAYGKFIIKAKDSRLLTEERGKDYELRHYHYDTFEVLNESGESEFKITFHADEKGDIVTINAPFEPTVPDIVFTRTS